MVSERLRLLEAASVALLPCCARFFCTRLQIARVRRTLPGLFLQIGSESCVHLQLCLPLDLPAYSYMYEDINAHRWKDRPTKGTKRETAHDAYTHRDTHTHTHTSSKNSNTCKAQPVQLQCIVGFLIEHGLLPQAAHP